MILWTNIIICDKHKDKDKDNKDKNKDKEIWGHHGEGVSPASVTIEKWDLWE